MGVINLWINFPWAAIISMWCYRIAVVWIVAPKQGSAAGVWLMWAGAQMSVWLDEQNLSRAWHAGVRKTGWRACIYCLVEYKTEKIGNKWAWICACLQVYSCSQTPRTIYSLWSGCGYSGDLGNIIQLWGSLSSLHSAEHLTYLLLNWVVFSCHPSDCTVPLWMHH